jgi:hypothetical protein
MANSLGQGKASLTQIALRSVLVVAITAGAFVGVSFLILHRLPHGLWAILTAGALGGIGASVLITLRDRSRRPRQPEPDSKALK